MVARRVQAHIQEREREREGERERGRESMERKGAERKFLEVYLGRWVCIQVSEFSIEKLAIPDGSMQSS